MRRHRLAHEFVEYVPEDVRAGVVYVSTTYATATHKCCCGCNNEVVTPLLPTDWELTFDGESISLYPSIGNWSLPCQSHYWITRNQVKWDRRWSKEEIEAGRAQDRMRKERYYRDTSGTGEYLDTGAPKVGAGSSRESLWRKLTRWWAGG